MADEYEFSPMEIEDVAPDVWALRKRLKTAEDERSRWELIALSWRHRHGRAKTMALLGWAILAGQFANMIWHRLGG